MVLNFVCRNSKCGKNGQAPLELSIIVNGGRKVITLERRLNPKDWDAKKQKAKRNPSLNEYIETIRTKIYSIETEILKHNLPLTSDSVIDAFKNGFKNNCKGFVEVFDEFINEYGKEAKCSLVQYNKYKKTKEYLSEYILEKTTKNDIFIQEVTPTFIDGFYKFLLNTNSNNTAINKMKQIKKVLTIAYENGYIDSVPFKLKMHKDKLTYTPLTIDEIKRIREKEFVCDRLNKVRDIIVVACYTGLAYTDLKELTRFNIVGNMIIKNRHKTDIQSTIPLLEPAREVLEKYNYSLPMLSNQKMNAYVKEIADVCGINKELHMHLFRHTFATILLNAGVDIVTVSKCCGHSNSRITESIYAQMETKTIENTVLSIADKIV